MIGLKYDNVIKLLSSEEFVGAFFDNIIYHLKAEKYPKICLNLNLGKLDFQDIPNAIKEIHQIKKEFQFISPEKLIWDINNIDKSPPWDNLDGSKINCLYDYFITTDGKNFFDVFIETFENAYKEKYDVVVNNIFMRPDTQPVSEFHG